MGVSGDWRLRYQRYRLEGSRCRKCNNLMYPPRRVCTRCNSRDILPHQLPTTGTVYSYTIIRIPPAGFEKQKPYAVALIQLDDGPMITSQLTDVDMGAIDIGMKVEMVTRKISEGGKNGVIVYGYKFRPPIDQPDVNVS